MNLDNINLDYIGKQDKKDYMLSFYERDFKRTSSLDMLTVKDATFLPRKQPPKDGPLHGLGGILDSNGNYVDMSATVAFGRARDRFIGKYEYDKGSVMYIDEDVVYLGLFHPHWGHFLVDFVPRLWPFVNGDFSQYKLVYTGRIEISRNYLEFLEMLGISNDQLMFIDEPTKFKSVIIPELSYIANGYWTEEFVSIFQKVRDKALEASCAIETYENIYLSRRHLSKWKEVGEPGIEKIFVNNGFVPVYMEEHTFAGQVKLLNSAKRVVAFSGTLCHNILFGNDTIELVILEKMFEVNTFQILLNQSVNAKVTYIDIYKEPYRKFPITIGQGPFWVTNRAKTLKSFCERNQMQYFRDNVIRYLHDFLEYSCLCSDYLFGIKHYKIPYPLKTLLYRLFHFKARH